MQFTDSIATIDPTKHTVWSPLVCKWTCPILLHPMESAGLWSQTDKNQSKTKNIQTLISKTSTITWCIEKTSELNQAFIYYNKAGDYKSNKVFLLVVISNKTENLISVFLQTLQVMQVEFQFC